MHGSTVCKYIPRMLFAKYPVLRKCRGSHMYCTQAVLEVSPSREMILIVEASQMVSGRVPVYKVCQYCFHCVCKKYIAMQHKSEPKSMGMCRLFSKKNTPVVSKIMHTYQKSSFSLPQRSSGPAIGKSPREAPRSSHCGSDQYSSVWFAPGGRKVAQSDP